MGSYISLCVIKEGSPPNYIDRSSKNHKKKGKSPSHIVSAIICKD